MKAVRLIFVLYLAILMSISLSSQAQQHSSIKTTHARLLGKTPPLRTIYHRGIPTDEAKKQEAKKNRPKIVPNFQFNETDQQSDQKTNNQLLQQGPDPLVNQSNGFWSPSATITPIVNVEGVDENTGAFPPDPNGDIGAEYYVQTINASWIYVTDKSGNPIVPAFSANALWQEFNLTGFGDPIVLYDQEAQRWLITEFAGIGLNTFLIAVSKTSDPLGEYFAYEFQADFFPDYPKYSIWDNSYVITTNDVDFTLLPPSQVDEIPFFVMDREGMLTGNPLVELKRVVLPKFDINPGVEVFQVAAPVHWNGNTPPPEGSPVYIMRMYDDTWNGGVDKLEIWEFMIDWDSPDDAILSGPLELPTTPFNSSICAQPFEACMPQVGFSVTLPPLQHVLMHRVNYRNFGDHESIVLNHVVNVDGNIPGQAGIRWYELRKTAGADWSIYQEGTYAPDTDDRFMGSINIDGDGNIALAYTIASESKEPSLRFTGRRVGDPLGEMTIVENEFASGTDGPFGQRWGDYASMSVDPVDNRTFWFTGEYQKSVLYGTKIVAFQLETDTIDVGPSVYVTPQNSGFYSDSETVTISFRNFGMNAVSNIPVGFQMNEGTWNTDTITASVDPGEDVSFTFTNTVDMTTGNEFRFKVFAALPGDENQFNDTLFFTLNQLVRLDAAVVDIEGTDIISCNPEVSLGIVIGNLGQDTLVSAEIFWQLDDEPIQSDSWTGFLLPFETAIFEIDFTDLSPGTHTITAFTSLPNGEPDEQPQNDTLTRSFNTLDTDLETYTIEILTDFYANETTWELEDQAGNILYEGGPYATSNNLEIETICLDPEQCYVFTIFDSFGDGIYLPGYYVIKNEAGDILAEIINNDFGYSETNSFCGSLDCLLDAMAVTSPESDDGNADGVIMVNAVNVTPPVNYTLVGGSTNTTGLFSNLEAGDYTIIINDDFCSDTIEVNVPLCLLEVSATVENETVQGEADGSIELTTSGGFGDLQYSIDGGVTFQFDPLFENLAGGVYNVVVADTLGCERTLQVTVGTIVGTDEVYFGYAVQVAPNPTNGTLRIEVSGMENEVYRLPVQIFDSNGRLLFHSRLARYDRELVGVISLVNYPSGIYYIRLQHEGLNRLVKVVKH